VAHWARTPSRKNEIFSLFREALVIVGKRRLFRRKIKNSRKRFLGLTWS